MAWKVIMLHLILLVASCLVVFQVNSKRLNLSQNEFEALTGDKRFFSYLIECALPKHTQVEIEFDSNSTILQGHFGLAENWAEQSLSIEKQRWVTACLLARVNHFGTSVLISMRTINDETYKELQPTQEEIKDFSLYEGGFYGNIFSATPWAKVCVPNRNEQVERKLIEMERICALPAYKNTKKQSISACHFIITNNCPVGEPVIHVYLK